MEVEVGTKTEHPATIRFDAQYRPRGAVRVDGADAESLRWQIPQRVRAGMEIEWRGVSARAQFQDVREWGGEPGVRSTFAATGLHQGYGQIAGARGKLSGFVRLGRQEMAYGSFRMLGNAPWNPNGQALNGLRLHGQSGPWSLDVGGFLLKTRESFVVETEGGREEERSTGGEWLGTVELAWNAHRSANLALYSFFNNSAPDADHPSRETYLATPGLRVYGEPVAGLTYDVEGYAQFGRWYGRDHAAWSLATTLRYDFDAGPVRPGLMVSYAIASGESCDVAPTDEGECSGSGTHTRFDPLFGSRHRYLGYADWFAYTNVRDLQAGPELRVGKILRARAHYHFLQLDRPDGAWIRTSLGTVGGGAVLDSEERTVGHELDLRLQARPWAPLEIDVGYAVLLPTGIGTELLSAEPQHFAYLMTTVQF